MTASVHEAALSSTCSMLHADLDDEQRIPIAADLDSSTSSPSSTIPPLYDSRRRSKSASRHRSHTTTDGSSTSHLLARLVSREEEIRELNAAFLVTTERLEAESSRANAAERRALDYFHRLRIATENRERADQESARLREELKLYKLQLENAQKEIFRAQDIIDQVAAQRNEAEAEAARARTKARKLQEEKLVMLAREEGRRVGYREGLSMGRRIGYDQGQENFDDGENVHELLEDLSDDERNDPRSHIHLRSAASLRQQPPRPESAPPVRTLETAPPLPVPSRISPVPIRTPSHVDRTPSPPREPDAPETIHPIPIRASPITPVQHIVVPPDGWIPRADSRTSYIHVPPPHELRQPVPPSPSSAAEELEDSLPVPQPELTPVPPPVRTRDYAYQTSVPPPVHGMQHTPSLASRTSTHISQYDLVNKRPASSLRNEIYIARAGSGSQPSRASTSRSEHREQDRHRSDRTEAESIVEQWRADSDTSTPPRNPNPPRSYTPSSGPPPRRPTQFYYRPREIVTPTPLGDVGADPRPYSPASAAPSARHPPPDDDPGSHPARTRSPLEYLRQRFRQRPSSGGSGSIPNIVVESPSEPETSVSPSATIAAQPELLSPEAANRPLPQDDPGYQAPSHSRPSSQFQSRSQRRHPAPSSSAYDRSAPWPTGFVPYPTAPTPTPEPRSQSRAKDHRRSQPDRDPGHARTPSYSHSSSNSYSQPQAQPQPHTANGPGYARTRTQSTSSMGHSRRESGDGYEAAPLPPGVVYPAPPTRPHTSHARHRERDRERVRERDGVRDWERERDKDRDRRRDSQREREYEGEVVYERDKDKDEDDEEQMLTQSPAPLARPISLFDSDES